MDICAEAAQLAKTVYLSHNRKTEVRDGVVHFIQHGSAMPIKFDCNVKVVPAIEESISADGFRLSDGTTISGVDILINTTGYNIVFPFLDKVGIKTVLVVCYSVLLGLRVGNEGRRRFQSLSTAD